MSRITCCESSVGALVYDPAGRLLMITRAWHPIGIAPVAGHVWDEHDDPMAALAGELREEAGLTLTGAQLLHEGWLPNRCQSRPGPRRGHHWWIYDAQATGLLAPSLTETKGASWYAPEEVQTLANRTASWLHGAVTDEQWNASPGLEPVWLEHLARHGRITATRRTRDLARAVYSQEPDEYWPPLP